MRGLLNKEKIVASFENLGIKKGDHLMVHASLSLLGVVEGGARTVVEAMLEAVGSEGTVIMPSFRSAIRSEEYGIKECENCDGKELCTSNERATTGAVSESLRTYPGAVRSCHPTSPWSGFGGQAKELLGRHRESPTQCGKGSPFFQLMRLNGKVLLLGVGVNGFTNIHSVEDARGLPYVSAYDTERRHATYTTSGRRIQYQYPMLLDAALKESGIVVKGRVGSGLATVIKSRDVGSFLWQAVEDNPWCLIVRPNGKEYYPFGDACFKVSQMVKAWKNNPDKEAWKKLLEKSEEDIIPPKFEPCQNPRKDCPAYAGFSEGYHRCKANDPAPWEKFSGYPPENYGIATCNQCPWTEDNSLCERGETRHGKK
jgi:aminoglycoside 3-N-acetyltransferase